MTKKLSHMTLSKQSPTDPIEGRTPDFVATSANGGEVQWLIWSERSTAGGPPRPQRHVERFEHQFSAQ